MIKPIHDWLTLDEHNIQMPWYTRPCLEVLNDMDFEGKSVFEFGVGNSSIWYKSRGASVYGVDSNKDWIKLFRENVGEDILYCRTMLPYCMSIFTFNRKFDYVIIDGLFRDECTWCALEVLEEGGTLILDNWLQPEVEEHWPKSELIFDKKGLDVKVYKEEAHGLWKTAMVTV